MDVLVGIAQELRLEGEALRVALNRREYEERVLADEHEAEVLGIRALGKFTTLKSFHVGEKLFAEGEPGEDWRWCYPDELFME